jgi:hypothetical protein
VLAQVLSGLGWSAFHVGLSNLTLKLSSAERWPSYLASFGATSGLAERVGPIVGRAALALAQGASIGTAAAYHLMMVVQFTLYAAATTMPSWITEPGGTPVGHLIRVMARYRTTDASCPVKLIFEYACTHLARLADLVAREFPRDAEAL